MGNPQPKTHAVSLEEQAALKALMHHEGRNRVAEWIGCSNEALIAAAAGLSVRAGTRALIRAKLEAVGSSQNENQAS